MKEKEYNITFEAHRRTSLFLYKIPNNIVYAKNKQSAKELGEAIIRDFYEQKGSRNLDYMVKQYKLVITLQ